MNIANKLTQGFQANPGLKLANAFSVILRRTPNIAVQNSGLGWNFGGEFSRHFIADAHKKQICSDFSWATQPSADGMINA